jgi:protease II
VFKGVRASQKFLDIMAQETAYMKKYFWNNEDEQLKRKLEEEASIRKQEEDMALKMKELQLQ